MDEKIKTARQMLLDYARQQMEAKNLTQQMVANRLGWHQQTVQRMLSGKFSPKLDHFLMLCEAVDCYMFVIDKNANDDTAELMRKRWKRNNDEN